MDRTRRRRSIEEGEEEDKVRVRVRVKGIERKGKEEAGFERWESEILWRKEKRRG